MARALKVIILVALVLGMHYLLWYKIYRVWFGHWTGVRKVALLIGCVLAELTVVILLLMSGLVIR